MPVTPLDALRRILARRPEVRDDPETLRNLLLDHCPTQRSEINWLVNAAVERVPARIAGAGDDTPRDVLLGAVKSTLARDLGMTADAAAWTAGTWYDALRTPDQPPRAPDPPSPARQPPVPAATTAESATPAKEALPEAPAPKGPEISMDMIRGAHANLVATAWRSLVIAIAVSIAAVIGLLQVQFFSDDIFGRLESLRTGDFTGAITGHQDPAVVWPLLLYAVLAGLIIAVMKKRIEAIDIADRKRRMWSPNPNDWTK
jgi:hypothetical protein